MHSQPKPDVVGDIHVWEEGIRLKEENLDELRRLEVENVGKPVSIVDFEFDLTLDNWRFFAGAARHIEGKAAGEYWPGATSFVRRDPLGVVAATTPWNYPLNMATWKLGPALAAGNTIVLKPSEITPVTAILSPSF